MTSSAEIGEPPRTLSVFRRALILVTVTLGATLYVTTIMVASTVLPQMQGAMSATPDEISWTMTFNILATAVVTPMTGWLVARFGQRAVMEWCVFGFTAATFFCGAAQSLESLVFWRIMQGGIGAPVIPLAQTILLAAFPPRQHGMVTGVYGMGIVLGPILGPTFGGLLAELYSWRWAFYMIVPIGFVSVLGLRFALDKDRPTGRVALDWTGFLSLSVAVACVQLVLSRGQRLDWFDSPEIVIETFLAVLAFYIFIAHSLTARQPFLNLKLLLNRDYAVGLALVGIFGMLNFTPMVLLPPLLQQHAGFPDALIGQVVGSRGIGAMLGFFVAIFLPRSIPRTIMMVGFGVQVVSGLWLMSLDLNVDTRVLMINGIIQGFAVGTIWVPLTVLTFSSLSSRYLAEATAVFHLIRNIGASLFISICVAEIVRATGLNYGRMTELISPFNEVLTMPWALGAWSVESVSGLARLSKEITRQSAMIGYINAFGIYTAVSAAAIPLLLMTGFFRRARAPLT
ncbi:MAG: DHA2 family efflux MFS transporter permease subunit [Hyphomicrobiales bacterium]|nr:DHA2 family efflux MFS transporter permease subunit [Hyphomicrobiales bacterium]